MAKHDRIELVTYKLDPSDGGEMVGTIRFSVPFGWLDSFLLSSVPGADKDEERVQTLIFDGDLSDTYPVYWAAIKAGVIRKTTVTYC